MASLVFWNRGDLCRKIQLSLLLWATKSYGNIPCREHNGKVNGLWQQHSCLEKRKYSDRQQKVKVQPFTFDFRLIFLPRAENLLHGENGEHSSLFWKVITVLPLILYQCCLCHVEYITRSFSKLDIMYVYYKFIFLSFSLTIGTEKHDVRQTSAWRWRQIPQGTPRVWWRHRQHCTERLDNRQGKGQDTPWMDGWILLIYKWVTIQSELLLNIYQNPFMRLLIIFK